MFQGGTCCVVNLIHFISNTALCSAHLSHCIVHSLTD